MRRAVLLSVVLVLVACDGAKVIVTPEPEAPPPPTPAQQDAEQHVRAAARGYAEALTNRDPTAALEWVVPETLTYYDDLRLAALRASREQLERWDLMSIMLILQLRATITRDELEAADGRALFERAVHEGLVGGGVEDVPLDEVWIDPDGLHAEIRVDGEPVVWLRREVDEHWRVDIPEMIRVLGPAVEAMARERIVADGKLRTAYMLIELSGDASADVAVLDGPLDSL